MSLDINYLFKNNKKGGLKSYRYENVLNVKICLIGI